MRVIAGSAKGMRLGTVPPGTRPLSDRAREGVFASLGPEVVEARCLDLFAGTGAVGIEALSRGAATCTFVERSREATAAIRANLEKTRLGVNARVHTGDVLTFLRTRGGGTGPFDLVFLDPPYEVDVGYLGDCLAALDPTLAQEDWRVVVTRGQKGLLPGVPVHWAARRQLRYGDSLLILYREVGWA